MTMSPPVPSETRHPRPKGPRTAEYVSLARLAKRPGYPADVTDRVDQMLRSAGVPADRDGNVADAQRPHHRELPGRERQAAPVE